ncbi:alpha/beta fold hydrolase [Agromyces sp. CFH 90414]|uniref:Alpha/beta fold hydrolase n=1 Tax=Agromyces agglutinans TaxID=2662258 RepID=A0A6I2F691_9MICO|nr:alpha/beta fold hydrolase [Agromyces agglutinans]MRG60222.1 alpha/beta fold hydrolase [Agromyces agglutinans]
MARPLTISHVELRQGGRFGFRVVDEAPALPSEVFLRGTLVVLVHGFATNRGRAERGYGEFATHVSAASRRGVVFLGVHWPGDHPWGPLVSVPTFSLRVGPAEESGRRIAQLIERTYSRSVVLVGHSLGCRVVLSALAELGAEHPRVRVRATYLMAAAVPEADCRDGARYGSSNLPRTTQVVRSSLKDPVLRGLFRPGMFLARGSTPGGERDGGRAVGRSAGPPGRWTGGWWSTSTELKHGEYWGSEDMARQLALVTGVAKANTPARRQVRSRDIGERRVHRFEPTR